MSTGTARDEHQPVAVPGSEDVNTSCHRRTSRSDFDRPVHLGREKSSMTPRGHRRIIGRPLTLALLLARPQTTHTRTTTTSTMTSAIRDFIPHLMLGSIVQCAYVCWVAIGRAVSLRAGYGRCSSGALAHESGGCDDRPRRAAPPFAPFGGLAGETDGAAP
jgi:hypothetical protein